MNLDRVQDWDAAAERGQYRPERVARVLTVDVRTLERFIHAHHGVTPREWLGELRDARVAQLLQAGELSVKEIAHVAGYAGPSEFCRAYKQRHGHPPLHP